MYDCAVAQGDVQVFRRGSRTLLAYTADDISSETVTASRCYRDVGITDRVYGTFLIDVTEPLRPETVGFVPISKGSHNQSVHPSGRYLYNSNADLSSKAAELEVIDISNLTQPRRIANLPLGLGLESHDVTFSANGKRAYVAAITHSLILDTSNPRTPMIIGRILDPAINIHHQSDPITLVDPILGKRTFLIVTDEVAGAAGNGFCPGGGLHVFDVTGDLERTPVKVGFWAMPEVRPAFGSFVCTSHVLRLYHKRKLMTIGWYEAGVRVVDVSGLAGLSVGAVPTAGNVGAGMREIGYYALDNADTWSAKTNRFEPDGSFYLFGNDRHRGLDVYRFDAKARVSDQAGSWLTPDEVLGAAMWRGASPARRAPVCVLRR